MERQPVRWPLPEAEGKYFLTAILTARGKEPVISQRIARVLSPLAAASAPDHGLLLVLGADAELRGWLQLRGVRFVETVNDTFRQAAAACS